MQFMSFLPFPKVACLLKSGLLYKQIMSSPAKSILGVIYEKTRFRPEMVDYRELIGDRCALTFDMFKFDMYAKMTKISTSKDIFIVGEQDFAQMVMSSISILRGFLKKGWVIDNAIFRHNLVGRSNFPV